MDPLVKAERQESNPKAIGNQKKACLLLLSLGRCFLKALCGFAVKLCAKLHICQLGFGLGHIRLQPGQAPPSTTTYTEIKY